MSSYKDDNPTQRRNTRFWPFPVTQQAADLVPLMTTLNYCLNSATGRPILLLDWLAT